jgi:hypothetical protein
MARAKPLSERLLSKHYQTFYDALRECYHAGDTGDAALAEALPDVTKDRRVAIAAALGDMGSHDAGDAALRAAIESPGASRDLRCAGVLALAKRCGASASADFARSLASSDFAVKHYAMHCLAGAGDDRAWDQALKRLEQIVGRPTNHGDDPSEVAITIAYLARHVLAAGSDRSMALVRFIREHWAGLTASERRWVETHWPACAPGGGDPASLAPPDAESIRRSVRGPLMDATAYDFDEASDH